MGAGDETAGGDAPPLCVFNMAIATFSDASVWHRVSTRHSTIRLRRSSVTNPYLQPNGTAVLQDSWFCFLDILGFKEILKANDHVRISQFHGLLQEGRMILEGPPDDAEYLDRDFHALTSFTDNIALGFPIQEDGEMEAGMVFERVARFQLAIVLRGFFIRGGVAVGEAYIDELAVYGPALLEAYAGESELARDPRIVLTESAKTLVTEHLAYYGNAGHAPQNNVLKRDRDGQWFIDYLRAVIADESYDPPHADGDTVRAHRDVVTDQLRRFRQSPRIWSKYEWVALYHNDFCRRYPDLFDESFFIEIDTVRGQIGSIVEA
ncbi:hypothetical protein [Rhizobium leguminosarum]|uniref:hypothetical protein n=1 Tax=Rhizobium leguminosarum TaxID=384 RepID=UPI00143F198E|nr:hypothetical protein [Rhizobium leguminosarum]NKL19249.1 hypothetical protein [Rhizobium leguminosarum bv. viciae]NKM99699.1 hypothetical protein [Rhizobium leguminosarum bv. viciae]